MLFRNTKLTFSAAVTFLSMPATAQYIDSAQPDIYLYGNSAVQTGPNADIPWIYMHDQSILNHDAGKIAYAYLYDQAIESVHATQSWLFTNNQSAVTIGAGADLSWLIMSDQSTAAFSGGNLGWAIIGGGAHASFDLANGAKLSWLWFANNGGSAAITGYGLVATASSVSGTSATGTPFSINVTFAPCAWNVGCSNTSIDAAHYSGLQLIDLGPGPNPVPGPVPTPSPGGVPDAPVWAMLILGFGTLGTRLRARRHAARQTGTA